MLCFQTSHQQARQLTVSLPWLFAEELMATVNSALSTKWANIIPEHSELRWRLGLGVS